MAGDHEQPARFLGGRCGSEDVNKADFGEVGMTAGDESWSINIRRGSLLSSATYCE